MRQIASTTAPTLLSFRRLRKEASAEMERLIAFLGRIRLARRHAVIERFTRRADGELEPLIEGSSKPVAEMRTHAGITRVRRYAFEMGYR
jgi:hypothetical protein